MCEYENDCWQRLFKNSNKWRQIDLIMYTTPDRDELSNVSCQSYLVIQTQNYKLLHMQHIFKCFFYFLRVKKLNSF